MTNQTLTPALFYGRFSSTLQKETSIDDQLLRCREYAAEKGYQILSSLLFRDEALSASKADVHRPGLEALKGAIKARAASCLIVDELSRLDRKLSRSEAFLDLCEAHSVRVLSTDGFDSSSPNARFHGAIRGALDEQSGRDLKHRIERGMVGSLERGHCVSRPAFGFKIQKIFNEAHEHTHTTMEIDEENAAVVRRIFAMRANGKSYGSIARVLNAEGIRTYLDKEWSASTVHYVVTNRAYTGVHVFRGSKKFRVNGAAPAAAREYHFPHLALIDSETFYGVQPSKRGGCAPRRGGGKHVISGLFKCMGGHSISSVDTYYKPYRIRCDVCVNDRNSGLPIVGGTPPSYAVPHLEHVLKTLLSRLVGDTEFLAAFKSRARARLDAGKASRLEELKVALGKVDASLARLAEVIAFAEGDSALPFKAKIAELSREREAIRSKLRNAAAEVDVTPEELERQLGTNVDRYVARLFDFPPEKLRFLLSRIFPSAQLVQRSTLPHAVSVFKVQVSLAALYSAAASSNQLEDACQEFTVVLSVPRGRTKKGQVKFEPDVVIV